MAGLSTNTNGEGAPMHITGPVDDGEALPFRSARNPESSLFLDLDALGYVEEEHLLSGRAEVRGPDGELVSGPERFVTRLLVRRPRQGFSGTVHLEPFHVLAEDTPTWTSGRRHYAAVGDAWVGVTVNAGAAAPGGGMGGGVPMLKEADPQRYAALHLETVPPPQLEIHADRSIPFDPESMRRRLSSATPQGHDIIGQVAVALRDPASPLLGPAVAARVYASGWSQTGLFWRNYLDHGHHERVRRANGYSPIDAYLINVAPAPDHRPTDAVLWHVLSEAEVVGTLNPPMEAAADSDGPSRVRGFEVPGAFHYWYLSRRMGEVEAGPDHPDHHNDRPWHHVTHALLSHLDAWVRDGTVPPRAARITRDDRSPDGVARDEHGNARGGLRTPWLDVPSARYLPRCACNPGVGAMRPFTTEEIVRLYGSRSAYADRLADRAAELVAEGWLLARDAAELTAGRSHPRGRRPGRSAPRSPSP